MRIGQAIFVLAVALTPSLSAARVNWQQCYRIFCMTVIYF